MSASVFPARAGMSRGAAVLRACLPSVPRASGDEPYAAALDEAYDLYNSDGGDFDMLLKTLNIAGPNLNKALDSLGCAPYSRKDMQAQAQETDRLDELIEQRGKDDPALVARIMAEIDGEDA